MTDILGKYQLQTELGRGAFATVYRALDTTLERPVALKILHPPLLTDPVFVQRFQQEAKLMANLRHPHICTVFEVAQHEGQLYIAMQLADGPSLAQAIAENGAFTLDETLELLAPLCQVLDYAHRQQIVHRDLKPANILLDQELGPLLTDFGFARLVSLNSTSFSLSGGIIGTPAYIAPEVWELDVADPPADIYALGCIVYEMLSGDVLFAGPTPMQVMRAHDRGPMLAAEALAELPSGLKAVLRQALAREPVDRYGSATALWHALEELKRGAAVAQEAAAQAAAVAQWRAETEAAMQSDEWRVARMSVSRWLALAPNDPTAQAAQAEIEQRLRAAMQAAKAPAAAPAPSSHLESSPAPAKSEPVARPLQSHTSRWRWVGGLAGLLVLVVLGFFAFQGGAAEPEPALEAMVSVEKAKGGTGGAMLELGSSRVREVDGMTMVYVPAGTFMMGSDDSDALAQDDEKPAHAVTLDAFWLDRTEVTNAMYNRCVEADVCPASGYADETDYNGADYPVVGVSWDDAVAYCDWAGGRLPTEAEWEYAARGPDSNMYPWGEEPPTCDLAQYGGCEGDTLPVGSLPAGASWVGAWDMAGNLWEWVRDWHGSDYYGIAPENNPTGPDSGKYRVLRGGGWLSLDRYVRAAYRVHYNPRFRTDLLGFRCVVSPGNWAAGLLEE